MAIPVGTLCEVRCPGVGLLGRFCTVTKPCRASWSGILLLPGKVVFPDGHTAQFCVDSCLNPIVPPGDLDTVDDERPKEVEREKEVV